MHIIEKFVQDGYIHPPEFVHKGLQLLVTGGSTAYGVRQLGADTDFYGFCIPPESIVFPHKSGFIPGFGKRPPSFDQFLHITDAWDINIFNIVKFFDLCFRGNPNIIELLYVPADCVAFATPIGKAVLEHRSLFTSKACWGKLRGFATSQVHKILKNAPQGKRGALVSEYGYDVKCAAHAVRLLRQADQLFTTGTMNLRAHSKTILDIRNGLWEKQQVIDECVSEIKRLNEVCASSSLPENPPEQEILALLWDCLNDFYNSKNDIMG
jgi:uncharacterized protein